MRLLRSAATKLLVQFQAAWIRPHSPATGVRIQPSEYIWTSTPSLGPLTRLPSLCLPPAPFHLLLAFLLPFPTLPSPHDSQTQPVQEPLTCCPLQHTWATASPCTNPEPPALMQMYLMGQCKPYASAQKAPWIVPLIPQEIHEYWSHSALTQRELTELMQCSKDLVSCTSRVPQPFPFSHSCHVF